MSIFQFLAICFAIFMSYVVSIQAKKQILSQIEASFWFSVWGLFIIFAAFPELLLDLTDFLRFSRVFDLLVVLAFMVLTLMIFSSYFQQKSLTKKLERFIRADAIKKVSKN